MASPDSPAQPYPYQALGPREIRVLKVDSIEELKFSLHVVTVGEAIYSALSYAWGQPPELSSGGYVSVDGFKIRVSDGLIDFLSQVQRGFGDASVSPCSELLWTDALCINQNDGKVEKPAQVRLMSEIYTRASKVYIWLGQPSDVDENAKAVVKMKDLADAASQILKKLKQTPVLWNPYQAEEELRPWIEEVAAGEWAQFMNEDSETARAWKGIASILRAAWWSRAWTCQEGTVPDDQVFLNRPLPASEHRPCVTFLCGKESFSWPSFMAMRMIRGQMVLLRATQIMEEHKRKDIENKDAHLVAPEDRNTVFSSLGSKVAAELLDPDFTTVEAMLGVKANRGFYRDMTLLEAISRLRTVQCREDRDRIYAAMGLTDDSDKSLIDVDYSRMLTTEEVYANFAEWFLLKSDVGLDILGYAMKPADNPSEYTLPPTVNEHAESGRSLRLNSWMPDWADGRDIKPFPKALWIERERNPNDSQSFAGLGPRFIQTRPAYKAGRGLPDKRPRVVEGVLYLYGTCIDNVRQACARHNLMADLKQWFELVRAGGGYFTDEPSTVVRERTAFADIECNAQNRPSKRGGDILLYSSRHSRTDMSDAQKQLRLTKAFAMANEYRSMCFTERNYIGLAPESTLPGDIVCVVAGAQVLHVLRQRPESRFYEYIGECYLHGFMDGYAARLLEKGELVMIEFAIQ